MKGDERPRGFGFLTGKGEDGGLPNKVCPLFLSSPLYLAGHTYHLERGRTDADGVMYCAG